MSIDWVAFIADGIKMATPLVFAALAALITRQAGMFNMGVEGMILCSALGAVSSRTMATASGSACWVRSSSVLSPV